MTRVFRCLVPGRLGVVRWLWPGVSMLHLGLNTRLPRSLRRYQPSAVVLMLFRGGPFQASHPVCTGQLPCSLRFSGRDWVQRVPRLAWQFVELQHQLVKLLRLAQQASGVVELRTALKLSLALAVTVLELLRASQEAQFDPWLTWVGQTQNHRQHKVMGRC